jgi:hypothetical protein
MERPRPPPFKKLIYQRFAASVDWEGDSVEVDTREFADTFAAARSFGVALPRRDDGEPYCFDARSSVHDCRQFVYAVINSASRAELVSWAREDRILAPETIQNHDLRQIVLYARVGAGGAPLCQGQTWEDPDHSSVALVSVPGGWAPYVPGSCAEAAGGQTPTARKRAADGSTKANSCCAPRRKKRLGGEGR